MRGRGSNLDSEVQAGNPRAPCGFIFMGGRESHPRLVQGQPGRKPGVNPPGWVEGWLGPGRVAHQLTYPALFLKARGSDPPPPSSTRWSMRCCQCPGRTRSPSFPGLAGSGGADPLAERGALVTCCTRPPWHSGRPTWTPGRRGRRAWSSGTAGVVAGGFNLRRLEPRHKVRIGVPRECSDSDPRVGRGQPPPPGGEDQAQQLVETLPAPFVSPPPQSCHRPPIDEGIYMGLNRTARGIGWRGFNDQPFSQPEPFGPPEVEPPPPHGSDNDDRKPV